MRLNRNVALTTPKIEVRNSLSSAIGIRNTSGYALYVRSGYKERGPFGSYKPSPISRFLEKSLEPQQATAA